MPLEAPVITTTVPFILRVDALLLQQPVQLGLDAAVTVRRLRG
jgi:hypothetical protein